MCGEKERRAGFGGGRTGSPPRVRGKADVCSTLKIPTRITPACAGKSNALLDLPAGQRDHPRVCGEKRKDRLDYYVPQGSPPACAGKRCASGGVRSNLEDHPRVCGEKLMYAALLKYRRGSPPRVRGKGNLYLLDGVLDGITPAYAGKSSGHPPAPGRTRDHPRVCGEK